MTNQVSVDDKIFDFVYEMAMRDATMQMAYKVNKGENKSAPKKCKGAKAIIRDYIDSLLNDTADNFFYEVEDKFEKTINEEMGNPQPPKFTFGNCQKVINMTVKYLYIATYANKELRKNFENCHCPMDNIMIKKVKDELKIIAGEKGHRRCLETNKLLQNIIRESDEFKDAKEELFETLTINSIRGPWSQITQSDNLPYKLYQSVIKYLADKQGVSPIEYDYAVWNSPDEDEENKE